jgi:hypothetical protein
LCEVVGNVPAGNRRSNCEERLNLPATGGEGQGLGGMANICELPLNIVTWNKPKLLALPGLDQKVRG